ncbi:hypothetical protein BC938DRAFT_481572 [Jimgerdemannia flammicorona]|uniref:Transcriptional repressor Tup1 N-terminal domain-containing protein n=1 Tax=Jimgerdemannia flammicorona TaxID=994334 RepID=A0A433QFT8_9FUNG|nr:hypothetical protein BC938DRAFT_481572 [Jimgerdemannia flammicorona]
MYLLFFPVTAQIQEMNAFQQNLYELERTQQQIKKQYEEEIMHLRKQLEQARSGHPPTPGSSSSAPSGSGHTSQGSHQQPLPPNLGHGPSNLFGGIINNSQGGPQGPGLIAPPQMVDPSQQQNQHSGYPSGPGGPPGQPPNATGPGGPPGTPYMNGSGAPPSSSQQGSQGSQGHPSKRMRTDVDGPGSQAPSQNQPGGPQGMYGGAPPTGGMPTPPAPGQQPPPGQPGPMMGQGQPGQPGMGDWANGKKNTFVKYYCDFPQLHISHIRSPNFNYRFPALPTGYGYRGVAPGTPTSQPANLPSVDGSLSQQSSSGGPSSNKRKSGATGPGGPTSGTSTPPAGGPPGGPGRSGAIVNKQPQQGGSGPVVLGGPSNILSDVDPESVPASMKIEGPDWFAM